MCCNQRLILPWGKWWDAGGGEGGGSLVSQGKRFSHLSKEGLICRFVNGLYFVRRVSLADVFAFRRQKCFKRRLEAMRLKAVVVSGECSFILCTQDHSARMLKM